MAFPTMRKYISVVYVVKIRGKVLLYMMPFEEESQRKFNCSVVAMRNNTFAFLKTEKAFSHLFSSQPYL